MLHPSSSNTTAVPLVVAFEVELALAVKLAAASPGSKGCGVGAEPPEPFETVAGRNLHRSESCWFVGNVVSTSASDTEMMRRIFPAAPMI
jgi:hypothetical protein